MLLKSPSLVSVDQQYICTACSNAFPVSEPSQGSHPVPLQAHTFQRKRPTGKRLVNESDVISAISHSSDAHALEWISGMSPGQDGGRFTDDYNCWNWCDTPRKSKFRRRNPGYYSSIQNWKSCWEWRDNQYRMGRMQNCENADRMRWTLGSQVTMMLT